MSEVPGLRDQWYVVAEGAEVGGEPRPVTLFGDRYVVWRAGPAASVSAALDECPHRSARLSQGWVGDDGRLRCPYHGWAFDGDGTCVEIPTNPPGAPVPPRASLRDVHVEERYGFVWLCVGSPASGVPDLPEHGNPAFVFIHEMIERWSASPLRVIDNGLDVSHVAWVHRGTVGLSSAPELRDLEVRREGSDLWFLARYQTRIDERQRANTGITAPDAERITEGGLVHPLFFRGEMRYPDTGLVHVLYKVATPVDDHTTLFCQFIARNDDPPPERSEGIVALDRAVQAEDKRLLEEIEPDFPLDTTTEVHTKADRMTLEYRRLMADLAAGAPTVRPDHLWSTWARPVAS